MEAWTKRTLEQIKESLCDVKIINKKVETINKGSTWVELSKKSGGGSVCVGDWVVFYTKPIAPRGEATLYKLGKRLDQMFNLDVTGTTLDYDNPKQ